MVSVQKLIYFCKMMEMFIFLLHIEAFIQDKPSKYKILLEFLQSIENFF